ncbi:lipopolysaccharide transport periplasmic protein LptA [Candidatus Fukatsuia anoeciicola]|uniref:lipopolysaccharide transport periplasmic protein LptA n=1 Tax=Candidatus Fukatsuia anoeciicola TaxID=2994492 RepID=UPI0034645DA2
MKYKNKSYNILFINLFLILFLTSYLPSTIASIDNNKQLINIISDKQLLDIPNNISLFTKNVIITQNSIKIKADKVMAYCPNGDINKMVIEGFANPVTFYQIQNNTKIISGHSQKIRYEFANQLLVLIDNAYIKQLDSNIKADRITYLIDKQKIEAFSNKDKHVTTILLPAQLQDKEFKILNNKKDK